MRDLFAKDLSPATLSAGDENYERRLFIPAFCLVLPSDPSSPTRKGQRGPCRQRQPSPQTIVDEDKRGRVMSLFQVAWGGLTPVGSLAMGAVAGGLGIARTLQLAALGCVVSGLVVRVRARP